MSVLDQLKVFAKNIDFHPKLFETIKHYNKDTLVSDIIAGVIVAIVALPLAIAFAISSGVKPEQGIITAIIAGFLISFFGGSKVQIGGPTGSFLVIVYGVVSQFGMIGLIIATILAGLILITLGLLKLGSIFKYIPFPIIVGFTSGIAVTIFSTQIGDFFGMNFEGEKIPSDFLGKWAFYFRHIDTTQVAVLLLGILAVLIIIYTTNFLKKASSKIDKLHQAKNNSFYKILSKIFSILKVLPGSLVAVIILTIIVYILRSNGFDGIDTIGDRFDIPNSVPDAEIPTITWTQVKQLFPIAITIAMLGAIESLVSTTITDGVTNDKHNANTELIAQGIANVVTPIFGGIPAAGALARTMTNINNGGKTPIAGITHAIVLLLILLVFMPLAKYIPMVCLAGILIVVSYNMSEWRTFKSIFNNPKSDIAVLVVTFILTVIFDLTVAMQVGIVMACLFFMKRVAQTTNISLVNSDNPDSDNNPEEPRLIVPKGIEVYEINGPYFFGIANKFEEQIARINKDTYVIIVRMRKVPFVDASGLNNLYNLCKKSISRGIPVVLSGVQISVRKDLMKAKFDTLLGTNNICKNIDIAMERAEYLKSLIEKNESSKPEDPFYDEKIEVNS